MREPQNTSLHREIDFEEGEKKQLVKIMIQVLFTFVSTAHRRRGGNGAIVV